MIYLKLGGSLITDKSTPFTARQEVIHRLASEIADSIRQLQDQKLLIGHGSGSFGHHVASETGVHKGIHSPDQWEGFIKVWQAAQALHKILMNELRAAAIPSMSFSPSVSCVTVDGVIQELAVEPIKLAIEAGIVPVVHGDVVFDRSRGASIVSTEQVLIFLAKTLPPPTQVMLAGKEPGVFADRTNDPEPLPSIDSNQFQQIQFSDIDGDDVTGGMRSKVREALELASQLPETEIRIFSAEPPENLRKALQGEPLGTRIH